MQVLYRRMQKRSQKVAVIFLPVTIKW